MSESLLLSQALHALKPAVIIQHNEETHQIPLQFTPNNRHQIAKLAHLGALIIINHHQTSGWVF